MIAAHKTSLPIWSLALCCAALLAAPLAAAGASDVPVDRAGSRRLDQRFTVEGRPMVTLRNAQGRVVVKSWDRLEVEIIAERASDGIEVDAVQHGNRIEVVTHIVQTGITSAEMQANYELHVPEETELEIKNDSGSVAVQKVYSDISVDTVLSTVELTDVSGVLTVHTVDGSFLCLRCVGRIQFTSFSGGARFLQPTTQSLHAQTLSGQLLFDGQFRPNGSYILKTSSGAIDVLMSDKDSVKLSAHSRKGAVENQVSLKPEGHTLIPLGGVNSTGLVGTTGAGLARVELTSFSGKIRILKRDAPAARTQ